MYLVAHGAELFFNRIYNEKITTNQEERIDRAFD